MTAEHNQELASMLGIVRFEFDQSMLAAPILLSKLEYGLSSTVTYVLKHEGWFTIPQVRQAFHYQVRIKLFDCEYTTAACEPFNEFVNIFAKENNEADKVKKDLELIKKETPWTEQELIQYENCQTNRTSAKLMLNSLPGRLNLNINRRQTMLACDTQELIPLLGDSNRYNVHSLDELHLNKTSIVRAVYTEGTYEYHIQQYSVAPHLSAYMLGYSKMLMAESFQFLTRIPQMLKDVSHHIS